MGCAFNRPFRSITGRAGGRSLRRRMTHRDGEEEEHRRDVTIRLQESSISTINQ
jgi:hypothetical protein